MHPLVAPTLLGVLASLVASYVYASLSKTTLTATQVLLISAVAAAAVWGISRIRGRIRLASLSPVDRYYPKGQTQYFRELVRDLKRSRTLKVIGARGLDLIGERSPLGTVLSEDGWTGSLETFLLDPTSTHGRLRVNHLDVEKEKYQAEAQAVHKFLRVIATRNHVSVITHEYDATPMFRAMILDDVAYVSLYQDGVQGRLLPAFRLRSIRDPLYLALLTYCKHLRGSAVTHAYPERAALDSASS